ncbi:hypothetical protein CLQ_13713 (plasmid) [Clostridium botulinum Af84]|uniref:hypothetical protein n=1 Tax=Clostridium botulinum TaxID=1491 RepID=UPI00035BA80D|nr:hypothetical protein [Clostridium botulinum]APR02614.1 hypothetical protein RSJ2_3894 [Clostridium botulinum]AUN19722.1 hypothetical protein B2M06_19385 [Clostridium botulinum]EPS54348.1 hypothetical protein CLQ_13713 [Clostridium botulinum Af84]OSA73746.1 hypothetical protein B2H86_15530 [Clostridium botulinum]OSA78767.1 hypothetical protein B2H84_12790 [Clostridium botulinum]
MEDNKNIILTEDDRKTIDALKVSPILKISNIGRKNKVKNILSIEDLSVERLKDLLPKIDMYIKELYDINVGLDEVWIMEYYALMEAINKKLEGNQNLNDFSLNKAYYKRLRSMPIETGFRVQTLDDIAEQLRCNICGVQITAEQYRKNNGVCEKCGAD